MKSIYDNWLAVETGADYFAGANTPSGFQSSYDTIADESRLDRVYIIKGGSGTGKSTLLYSIAAAAENRGSTCEYYLCGSDPDSLDCVVIDRKIAVLDGTSPHVREMHCPGASSAIIDVSRFWDSAKLEPHRDEIAAHSAMKQAAYASCYRWLAAADEVHRERLALAEILFNRPKAEAFIGRLIAKLGKTEPGESRTLWSHAVTMKGRWHTRVKESGRIFTVNDSLGTAPVFLALLDRILTERKIPHTTAVLPLTDTPATIVLDSVGVTVTACVKNGSPINMTRFIRDDVPANLRGRIRLTGEITQSCLNAAADSLKEAADHHFAVEQIYKPVMDFKSLSRYGGTVTKEILARL
ncbi:MAG: hypothetical protein IJ497_03415 [Clostridia bacterium]|nr:hypothetical protein [Clostridia bacterium]